GAVVGIAWALTTGARCRPASSMRNATLPATTRNTSASRASATGTCPLPVMHARERGHVADEGGDQPKPPECEGEARCRRPFDGVGHCVSAHVHPWILPGTASSRLRA